MYVFLIEPKGRFFRKISQRYEPYIEKRIDIPIRPYYFYRINENHTLQDVLISEMLVVDSTTPWLFKYSNGVDEYSEEVVAESVILLRNLSAPPLLQIQNINLVPGDILAFLFFLGLKDDSGRPLRKSFWDSEEIEYTKKILASFLLERTRGAREKAKRN